MDYYLDYNLIENEEYMENIYPINDDERTEEKKALNDIKSRRNPILTDEEKEEAEEIEGKIKAMGLINFLEQHISKLYIGNKICIYRMLLASFMIMIGDKSYLMEIIGKREEGKSLQTDIVFSLLIPDRYVHYTNNFTKASFTRCSELNPSYFTRTILFFGDFGSKKSYKNMEEVFNILKELISEGKYIRMLTDKTKNGTFNNKKLKLIVESIGGVYSAVQNEFADDNGQLESRTISCSPQATNDREILEHLFELDYTDSEENNDKTKAIAELKKFKSYLLSLVNLNIDIINPYQDLFIDYSLQNDNPKRTLVKELGLFKAYCIITHHDCDNINGKLVASKKQIQEYMEHICLKIALIPYEYDFLQMLMAKGKTHELTIIDTDDESEQLESYFSDVLSSFNERAYENAESIAYLTVKQQKNAMNKLMSFYKLDGQKEDVFFREGDIKRVYLRYKAYQNIEDVPKLLNRLETRGYIRKLEYRHKNEAVYYLTSQCNDIAEPFYLTEEYIESAEAYLKSKGITE